MQDCNVRKCGACRSLSQQARRTSFLAVKEHLQNADSNNEFGGTAGSMIRKQAAA